MNDCESRKCLNLSSGLSELPCNRCRLGAYFITSCCSRSFRPTQLTIGGLRFDYRNRYDSTSSKNDGQKNSRLQERNFAAPSSWTEGYFKKGSRPRNVRARVGAISI